ncbi:unnamed protein product [Acidithrix sp. C25]|nr:unnamed protein product [Acidithrix sp. C25]
MSLRSKDVGSIDVGVDGALVCQGGNCSFCCLNIFERE